MSALDSATALPLAHQLNSTSLSPLMRSSLVSRNITINAHRTSIRLEPDMWNALRDICRREHMSIHEVCSAVATQKPSVTSLTAAIRVFIMAYFRAAATEDGHSRAGHGPGGQFMLSQKQQSAAKTINAHTVVRYVTTAKNRSEEI